MSSFARIKKIALATCLICVLALTSAAQKSRQSTLRLLPDPEPSDTQRERLPSGTRCVSLGNDFKLCKYYREDEDTAYFAVEKRNAEIGRWAATPTYTGVGYEALTGDLDGDARLELVVANHDGTSNGLGVSTWTIYILPDPREHDFREPLRMTVREYGTCGTFVARPGGSATHILATDWEWGADPQDRRGYGLYFVGRWFRYADGRLLPVARPVLARRYLFSFQDERGMTSGDPRAPYRWLRNLRTERRRVDPYIVHEKLSSRSGTVESVDPPSDSGGISVRVRFDDGETTTFVYNASPFGGEALPNGFSRFGEATTDQIYPINYLPSDAQAWLSGRRVTVVVYKGEYEPKIVLWV